MQAQRNSVESISEPLQFDCSPISNSSAMDQPFYQSNLILNSAETPTLADFLLSPNDTDMDYLNMAPQDTDGLNIWNSHDINSNAYIANQENQDTTKMDHDWNTALSINSASGPRMEERQCERNDIASLENVDFNLNNTPADDGQAFRQNLISSHVNQRTEHNVHTGPHNEIAEVSLCPFLPEFFDHEHVPYPNTHGSSSSVVGQVSENDNRGRSSADGQHMACKRKNIEGVIGESSTSNISADLSIPSSSRYLPASFLEDTQSPNFNPIHRGVCSEWNSASSLLGNTETSLRNIRARINPARHDISSFQSHSSGTSNRMSSIWSPGETSSNLNPYNHSPEQIQPHLLVPALPPNINLSPSSSRIGGSAFPTYTPRRLIPSSEESNIRSLPRNGIVDQPTFFARTNNVSQLVQDPPNWNPSNSSSNMPGNRASSSSGVIPSGSIRTPNEMVSPQYHRNLSDIFRSSLFPSGGSESGHQSSNSSSRQSGRSAAMHEPGQSSRTALQGHSPLYPRANVSLDRQRDGVSGINFPARNREGRSRMISEIRNALDLMRRGVNLRFEDVFFFDQSGFYGRADLFDRHRDMRLDVDNMSYEELLALEERIGYVNTGLGEETILKCLRQRKYSSCNVEAASANQEPCCICRENYIDGEDVSTLNCNHDFHTACIKEWLLNKNLCPICKTTALVT